LSQTERLYRLKHFFDSGRSFDKTKLMAELGGISFATLKRDIEHLRDRMNCPVVFDKQAGGYRLDPTSQAIGTRSVS
jgi:predicted DNA-binding transcriptional regulator YafY